MCKPLASTLFLIITSKLTTLQRLCVQVYMCVFAKEERLFRAPNAEQVSAKKSFNNHNHKIVFVCHTNTHKGTHRHTHTHFERVILHTWMHIHANWPHLDLLLQEVDFVLLLQELLLLPGNLRMECNTHYYIHYRQYMCVYTHVFACVYWCVCREHWEIWHICRSRRLRQHDRGSVPWYEILKNSSHLDLQPHGHQSHINTLLISKSNLLSNPLVINSKRCVKSQFYTFFNTVFTLLSIWRQIIFKHFHSFSLALCRISTVELQHQNTVFTYGTFTYN